MHALVAERGEDLLGIAHFLFHRSTTITVEPVCYLQDLFVAKDVRGKGVARGLIEAVYDRAQQGGDRPRSIGRPMRPMRTAMNLYDKIAEKSGFHHLSQSRFHPAVGPMKGYSAGCSS